jgi:hypothetical protein
MVSLLHDPTENYAGFQDTEVILPGLSYPFANA